MGFSGLGFFCCSFHYKSKIFRSDFSTYCPSLKDNLSEVIKSNKLFKLSNFQQGQIDQYQLHSVVYYFLQSIFQPSEGEFENAEF